MRPNHGGAHQFLLTIMIGLGLAVPAAGAWAETALARSFALAWQRQPVAAAMSERRQAVEARQAAASAWLPAPPTIQFGARSDRYHRSRGSEERDVGLILPLWLPGEREASRILAGSEGQALELRSHALRLQVAEQVREAWWAWQMSGNEQALSQERVKAAARLREDVARRYRAGDLSRADLNSAGGALALAEVQLAENELRLSQARFRLQSLTGQVPAEADVPFASEPLPVDSALLEHPHLLDLDAQAARAEAEVALLRQQSRSNPELSVSTRRDRAAAGDLPEQTVALALRFPLGGGPRHDARLATAQAEAVTARIEADRQRERLQLEAASGSERVVTSRRLLAAAEQRAELARENRSLFDKSFRLGESDWPTRLRIEVEAFEAERAVQRARIGLAQGISQWRQALGLLPE